MHFRPESFADRSSQAWGSLVLLIFGGFMGAYRRIPTRSGRGIELGDWGWVAGGGLIAVGAVGLILACWPPRRR